MKRHSPDLVSLLFGLIFLSVAGWWLVGRYVHLNVPHLGWILAGGLIVVGLLGVASSLRREPDARPSAEQPVPVGVAPTSGAAPTAEFPAPTDPPAPPPPPPPTDEPSSY